MAYWDFMRLKSLLYYSQTTKTHQKRCSLISWNLHLPMGASQSSAVGIRVIRDPSQISPPGLQTSGKPAATPINRFYSRSYQAGGSSPPVYRVTHTKNLWINGGYIMNKIKIYIASSPNPEALDTKHQPPVKTIVWAMDKARLVYYFLLPGIDCYALARIRFISTKPNILEVNLSSENLSKITTKNPGKQRNRLQGCRKSLLCNKKRCLKGKIYKIVVKLYNSMSWFYSAGS